MTLIDTSAWISFLRATGNEADRAVEALLSERARIFTTETVVAELLAGAGDEEAAGRLERLLGSVDRCEAVGPLDVERAAYLYRRCRDAGEPVGSLSVCLVAAVALRDDLEVLADDRDLEVLGRHAGLRLRPRAPGASGPAEAREHLAPSPLPLILVVEDDPSVARMLEGALTRPDRRMLLASTAKDARRIIAEQIPDAIVLDLVLPDEDGRNVLADLRRDARTKDTGVVIVTGRAGPRTREECFALGADDFFDKPFEVGALSTAVELVLVEGRASAPAPDPLFAPLTLSEVEKLLSARRKEDVGDGTWAVALLEIDAEDGAPGEDDGGGVSGESLLLEMLRSVISKLVAKLGDDDLIARWGVDQLVVVSTGRSEGALAGLLADLTDIPGIARHLWGRVRMVEKDEDLLDAVSTLAAKLAEERETQAPGISMGRAESRARPRATLVEDDPVTAGLVRHRLERSGFQVEHHTDGERALEAILGAPPNVVILDVQLPSMDGFEILGRMKEDARAKTVPVLMFTSLGRQEHVSRGFELGADDYVTKPFSPSELLTRVLRLVRKR